MFTKPILVLGAGDLLKQDDGIGIEVVRQLASHELPEEVEVIDGGTVGLYLLPHMDRRRAVLLVGAMRFGGKPGDVMTLKAADAQLFRGLLLSEREAPLKEVLALMEARETQPHEFVVMGCQPGGLKAGEPLSPDVAAAIPGMVDAALELVERWNGEVHALAVSGARS